MTLDQILERRITRAVELLRTRPFGYLPDLRAVLMGERDADPAPLPTAEQISIPVATSFVFGDRPHVELIVAKITAWDATSEALDENASGEFSAADVCACGFENQETIRAVTNR